MIEGPSGVLVGFYPYFIKTYIYAAITMFSMDYLMHGWKVAAGLKPHQM